MKIVLVSEHASPLARIGSVDAGGQNIYVAQLSAHLARAGHQVEVLTRRDDPSTPEVVTMGCGTRVVHVVAGPASFVPKEELLPFMDEFGCWSVDYLRRTQPLLGRRDVVHANFFMSGVVAERIKRALGLPFVVTFHALGLVRRQHQAGADGFPAERVDIERALVAQADQVIAECPQDASDLVSLYGATRHQLTTIPCGFDPLEFAPTDRAEARRRLGLSADEFTVLQLGRLVPRKGIDNVIRAVALLPERVAARLIVVGGDADTLQGMGAGAAREVERLCSIAKDCGAAHRVTFIGHRQRADLRRYYGACDVFATTPWYEPFGITPLEAMACARAVVGSNVGGIKHSVVHGETGLLVEPHDPASLAEALLTLHDDPARKEGMGYAGLARANARFTWRQVATRIEEVYESVCSMVDQPHLLTAELRDESPSMSMPGLPHEPVGGAAHLRAAA